MTSTCKALVLALALALLGLSVPNLGCTTTTRLKAIVHTTSVLEFEAKSVKQHCYRLAKEDCKTDPCPALETCKAVHKALVDAALLTTQAAKIGAPFLEKLED